MNAFMMQLFRAGQTTPNQPVPVSITNLNAKFNTYIFIIIAIVVM